MKLLAISCPACLKKGKISKELKSKKIECSCGHQFVPNECKEEPERVGFETDLVDFNLKNSDGVNRQDYIKELMVGESLILKRDANDFHNKNAIKVLNKKLIQLGSLNQECCDSLAYRLDNERITVECLVIQLFEQKNIMGIWETNVKVDLDITLLTNIPSIKKKPLISNYNPKKNPEKMINSFFVVCPSCKKQDFISSELRNKKFECSCGEQFRTDPMSMPNSIVDPWQKADTHYKWQDLEKQNHFYEAKKCLRQHFFMESIQQFKRSIQLKEMSDLFDLAAYYYISTQAARDDEELRIALEFLNENGFLKDLKWWVLMLAYAYEFQSYLDLQLICDLFKNNFKGHFLPHERSGFYAYLLGDNNLALDELNKSYIVLKDFKLFEKEQSVYLRLLRTRAKIYFKTKEFDRCLVDYKKIIELDSEDFESIKNCGLLFLELKKSPQALKCFDDCLKIKPKYLEAYYQRASLKIAMNDKKGALVDLNEILEIDPGNLKILEMIKEVKDDVKDQRRKKDLRFSHRFEEDEGDNKHKVLSDENEELNELKEQELDLRKQLRSDNHNAYFVNELAWCLAQQNIHVEAIELYNKALNLENNSFNRGYIFNNRGLSKNATEDYYGAISDFTEAIKLIGEEPNGKAVYLSNRAISKGYLSDFQGVIQDLEQGLKYENDKEEIPFYYFHLGIAYLEIGELSNSIDRLKTGLKLEKNDSKKAEFHNLLASCYCEGGKFTEAIKEYKECLKFSKDEVRFLSNLANAKNAVGEYEESVELFCIALDKTLDPLQASVIYFMRAMTKMSLDDIEGAYDDCTKSIELDSSNAEFYFNRALINENREARDLAKEDYLRVLEIDPDNIEAKERLNDLDEL